MQPGRDDHRPARVAGADERHVDAQLAPVRPLAGQHVALKHSRRRASGLAEALAGRPIASRERIEHGAAGYSGISANVQIEPPAGTRPRA